MERRYGARLQEMLAQSEVPSDLIDGLTIGGAATYIETATKCDINLYI